MSNEAERKLGKRALYRRARARLGRPQPSGGFRRAETYVKLKRCHA